MAVLPDMPAVPPGIRTGADAPSHATYARLYSVDASAAAPGLEWATLLQVFGLTDAATAMSMRTELAATQPLLLALWYDPFMDFRQHAQFMQFAERHGLAAYWRERGPPDSCIVQSDPAPRLECKR